MLVPEILGGDSHNRPDFGTQECFFHANLYAVLLREYLLKATSQSKYRPLLKQTFLIRRKISW